ncbi:MAG: phosphoribosylformylglycinamidine synthase subunit PurL [Acidobacteria bacterium]|nr:phosphoribosylformylglycinamidine synthase subunit PurL [Acidobacteriota bacterium]
MNREPGITPDMVREHDLTEEEYGRIRKILDRDPTYTELGIFSVMWSEHCSYKSSRVHLGRLPSTGPAVIQGPGENAGVVDIGGGRVAVFKIESHNHPSFIEPFQGAATGVGGILRDIFTMGARPVGSLNSLRFGDPSHPRTRRLLEGVIGGIAGYGNCIGVPTVGGEISFHPCYNGNILVNVFNCGIAGKDEIFLGNASGAGNPVIYVGSSTGRDGIHGASLLASSSFEEGGGGQRPRVQVGDPFLEKLLLEACLEAMRAGGIVGIQDMGAAGLTCSTLEMAGRGGTGIDLDLDAVPRREPEMSPYDVMLSESQERMLLVGKRGSDPDLLAIFRKWDLQAVVVGRVTDRGKVRVRHKGETVADLPVGPLSEEAPRYNRPLREPAYLRDTRSWNASVLPEPGDVAAILKDLLASPNIASKGWVIDQYDSTVRANTVAGPGLDAAVLRIPGTLAGIAMTTDGNSRHSYLHPFHGAAGAVAEASRNLSCMGAEPLALTDCLNFGSPENPEVMWQFQQTVEGIRAACLALEVPVVSGNVSFYNQTEEKPIRPTPVIGMIGSIADVTRTGRLAFSRPGDLILLLGDTRPVLDGTEYLARIHQVEAGSPAAVDFRLERAVQDTCREGIRQGWIRSAHDCSEGGLLVTLAEACFGDGRDLGGDFRIPQADRLDALLFGESASRIVVSVAEADLKRLETTATRFGAPILPLGQVRKEPVLKVKVDGERVLHADVESLRRIWREGFVRAVFGGAPAGKGGMA